MFSAEIHELQRVALGRHEQVSCGLDLRWLSEGRILLREDGLVVVNSHHSEGVVLQQKSIEGVRKSYLVDCITQS